MASGGLKYQKITVGQRFGRLTAVSDSGDRKKGLVVWNLRCDCGRMVRVNSCDLRQGRKRDCGCVKTLSPRQKDITGQVFGMLTALRPTEARFNGCTVWTCQCACGKLVDVPITKLTQGLKTHCGCEGRGRVENLAGLRVGRLTVQYYVGRQGRSPRVWHCRCDCGQELDVPAKKLTTGMKKHCGCQVPNRNTDLTGMTFGALTVLSFVGKVGNRNCWKCRCDCGRELIVPGSTLINGLKRNCGDLRCFY